MSCRRSSFVFLDFSNISKSTVSPNQYDVLQPCEPQRKVELDALIAQLGGTVPPPNRTPSRQRKPHADRVGRLKRTLPFLVLILLVMFGLWRFLLRPSLIHLTMTDKEIRESITTTELPDARPDIMLRPPEMSWNESELLKQSLKPNEPSEYFQVRAELSPKPEPKVKHDKGHFPIKKQPPTVVAVQSVVKEGRNDIATTTTTTTTTTTADVTSVGPSVTAMNKSTSDELSQLIDDLDGAPPEKAARPTTTTPRVEGVPARPERVHGQVVGGDEEDVSPVVLDFGEDLLAASNPHPRPPPATFRPRPAPPEPVWRITPADLGPAPPPPPPRNGFQLQATVQSVGRPPSETRRHPTSNHRHRHYSAIHGHDPRANTPVIVTALINIGRGEWTRFTRPYDLYLTFLMDLLTMDNRIIIYCDSEARKFLKKQDLKWERIQIVEFTLPELPLYKFRDEIVSILEHEQQHWLHTWDEKVKEHPESLHADYDILVNSKPYFLFNATQISVFDSEFFVWVDAGYSHGSQGVIPAILWDPKLEQDKITVIKITPEQDRAERYTLDMVYRKHWTVISGGVLAGDKTAIRRLNSFFFKTFVEMLDQRRVDDDQTTLLMTIRQFRSTFKILTGGWFDAFKLLPSRAW